MMMSLLRFVRAIFTRLISPKSSYWLATKSVVPLSKKFGFDRGKPIDRYWIESFLASNKSIIKGHVLEIVDNTYTLRFGKGVTQSDVLDLDLKNKKANIKGNLKSIPQITDNRYDCIILTHVLGMIDDPYTAIKECYRILKKDGYLITTVACFSSLMTGDVREQPYWRYTPAGLKYVMNKSFDKVKVKSYGNVLAGQCFWVGLSQEELTKDELDYNDPHYPCIVGAICQK